MVRDLDDLLLSSAGDRSDVRIARPPRPNRREHTLVGVVPHAMYLSFVGNQIVADEARYRSAVHTAQTGATARNPAQRSHALQSAKPRW